ncbi:AAA family ATPase [Methylobacterium sp. 10]|uniref:AAA family ATPase n=1 Tax=Methylobacterium sp. 10 TaxID=1101191 RepID=UPI0004815953|nr:AAA family ATPase [Methylobacterium sp. 10]
MLTVRNISSTGYRSLRRIGFPVDALSVFIGANGVGKTNLYRALERLQAAAAGTLVRDLAAEGGMDSVIWAGSRSGKGPVRVGWTVELGDEATAFVYKYETEVGLVPRTGDGPSGAAFLLEPQIKRERLTVLSDRRPAIMLKRDGPAGFARGDDGRKRAFGTSLLATATALAALQDAVAFPELHLVRRALLDWRFHHDFRTDAASALRRPCLAVTTPTLSSDGSDLAAVFATLRHIRQDTVDLDEAVADAFPGAHLVIPSPGREASFGMVFPDYPKRVFEAAELSDGTLRYLALAGALLAYRLPPFIALNEPETSLHPDLLDPLARMIVKASQRSQVWLVTHSERLADAIAAHGGVSPRRVVKREVATWIDGLKLSGEFAEIEDA